MISENAKYTKNVEEAMQVDDITQVKDAGYMLKAMDTE